MLLLLLVYFHNLIKARKTNSMALVKKVNLIIYRFAEKGLEIFMVNPEREGEKWHLPQGKVEEQPLPANEEDKLIALDPIEQDDGKVEQGYALEGDWHDIPSLKSMVKEDVLFVKDQIKQIIPEMMEKGTFIAVKDAFKRVLPHQYEMLKELKDILIDRNSVRDL